MNRRKRIRLSLLLGAGLAALTVASTASAHMPQTITIRHQLHGCHAWAFQNSPYKASLKINVDRDATLVFVNNDVMPHKLVQVSGAKVTLSHASMSHMSAKAMLSFPRAGVYKFTTKAGEDYPGMGAMKTIGEDNVLRLTVTVS